MASLEKIKKRIRLLTRDEIFELQAYLNELQAEGSLQKELDPIPVKANREIVETRRHGSKCYRLEKIKCGKKSCKCARGELHGPYWHAYYRQDGRLKCEYIGKTLPAMHPALKQHSERLRQKAQKERAKVAKLVQESRDLRSESRILLAGIISNQQSELRSTESGTVLASRNEKS